MLYTLADDLPPLPDDAFALYALCAQWCGTCREYRQTLESFAAENAAVRVLWLDVEDDAEAVDALDVENFPTLLIARGREVHFFGVVLPTRAALTQTWRAAQEAAASRVPEEATELAARLGAQGASIRPRNE